VSDIDEWEFNCSKCGSLLSVESIRPGNKRIEIDPCFECLNKKYVEGFDNAKKIVDNVRKKLNV